MVRGVGVMVESARRLGDASHHDDNLLADLQLCIEVLYMYMCMHNTCKFYIL